MSKRKPPIRRITGRELVEYISTFGLEDYEVMTDVCLSSSPLEAFLIYSEKDPQTPPLTREQGRTLEYAIEKGKEDVWFTEKWVFSRRDSNRYRRRHSHRDEGGAGEGLSDGQTP